MVSKTRLDELKQINIELRDFFGALLCNVSSIIKTQRKYFEAKARDFDKKRLEYKTAGDKLIDWTAVEAAIEKAAKTRGDKRECRRVHCTTDLKHPKEAGWQLIETGIITQDGLYFPWDFWAPPDFPDAPDDWFNIYDPSHYITGPFDTFKPKSICQREDELLRDSVAMVVLFNKQAEERGESPITPEILSDIKIPQDYETPAEKQQWPKVQGALVDALEMVNRDLADADQNNRTPPKPGGQTDTPITLREFMREYCDPLTPNLLESRVKALYSLHQRLPKIIELKSTGSYKRGQAKVFLPSYLKKMWPIYQKTLCTLPNLCNPIDTISLLETL